MQTGINRFNRDSDNFCIVTPIVSSMEPEHNNSRGEKDCGVEGIGVEGMVEGGGEGRMWVNSGVQCLLCPSLHLRSHTCVCVCLCKSCDAMWAACERRVVEGSPHAAHMESLPSPLLVGDLKFPPSPFFCSSSHPPPSVYKRLMLSLVPKVPLPSLHQQVQTRIFV